MAFIEVKMGMGLVGAGLMHLHQAWEPFQYV